VAIVNEELAKRLWSADDAIGKRVFNEAGQPLEVVGLVRAAKFESLFDRARPMIYLPLAQHYGPALTIHARTTIPAASALPALRRALTDPDPRLAAFDVRTMPEQIDLGSLPLRMAARMFALFGATALGLACLGLYGTLAFAVSQRIREIGVRMALGATAADVTRLVMSQAVRPLMVGTSIGLIPCVVAALVLQFELGIPGLMTQQDVWVLPAAAMAQTVLALAACWLPARRATRLDPAVALRCA
jgi:predicted lysophospholipase L1 biosynthesis ABC-type transport system permease subunit